MGNGNQKGINQTRKKTTPKEGVENTTKPVENEEKKKRKIKRKDEPYYDRPEADLSPDIPTVYRIKIRYSALSTITGTY